MRASRGRAARAPIRRPRRCSATLISAALPAPFQLTFRRPPPARPVHPARPPAARRLTAIRHSRKTTRSAPAAVRACVRSKGLQGPRAKKQRGRERVLRRLSLRALGWRLRRPGALYCGAREQPRRPRRALPGRSCAVANWLPAVWMSPRDSLKAWDVIRCIAASPEPAQRSFTHTARPWGSDRAFAAVFSVWCLAQLGHP